MSRDDLTLDRRSLAVSAYTVPTDRPEADGTLAWDSTTLVLVRARAGDCTGIGWTYAPAAAAEVVTGLLAPALDGLSATAPVRAWSAMARAIRNAGRAGLVAMAVSAVDIALWDLCARLQGLPLTLLWGHGSGARVPVYGSGGFTTYSDERTTAQLEGWLTLGLSRVKIKIGQGCGTDVARDLARTRLVREVVGDDIEVFVDANGAYSPAQACRVGQSLDDLGVTWFEEPVTSDDLRGLARVRDHVLADVAAGEYGWGLDYFDAMAPAVDCLQVDVTRCGGYTAWHRIVALAQARHVDVSGHCAPYLTVPAAAATPGFRHQEWFHDHVRIEQMFFDGCPDPHHDALVCPTEPGHGLRFRSPFGARYRVR